MDLFAKELFLKRYRRWEVLLKPRSYSFTVNPVYFCKKYNRGFGMLMSQAKAAGNYGFIEEDAL
nr:hypothetical protein [uncultured Dysosmobacter sp.]